METKNCWCFGFWRTRKNDFANPLLTAQCSTHWLVVECTIHTVLFCRMVELSISPAISQNMYTSFVSIPLTISHHASGTPMFPTSGHNLNKKWSTNHKSKSFWIKIIYLMIGQRSICQSYFPSKYLVGICDSNHFWKSSQLYRIPINFQFSFVHQLSLLILDNFM